MPTQIFLPDCLMEAYKFLFPTIDFSRVSFFDGIPWPLSWGSEDGLTLPDPEGVEGINVYLREETYNFCDEETFLRIAHELVHVLQMQNSFTSGWGLGLFNPSVINYLSCFLSSFSSHRDNPLEAEAYDYANGPVDLGDPPGQLRNCIESLLPTLLLPCDCSGIPWLKSNPKFIDGLMKQCPDIVKKEAKTSFGECLSTTSGLVGGAIGGIIGGLMGGPLGAAMGFVIGFIAGYFWSLILGFVGGFIGGIIGFIGSLIGSLSDAISNFFSGGGGVGGISLLFSSDSGDTFGNKITFESSSEPPALATDGSYLYIGWTDTDNHLNVFAAPNPAPKTTFEESNNDAGPALGFAFGQVRILWQDEDNHLHVMSSPRAPDLNFGVKLDLGQTLAGSASPALTLGKDSAGNDLLYLAWIDDDDNKIYIRWSIDGVDWGDRVPMNASSTGDGTPAIAFGNGRLYLAWIDDDDNNVHVKSFLPLAHGSFQEASNTRLEEVGSDDAGPALAFGNSRLFLAWTDDDDHLQVMYSDDPDAQTWQPKQELGHSSDNAGPALVFIPGGIVCAAWIDK
jgi:hypothetical protein